MTPRFARCLALLALASGIVACSKHSSANSSANGSGKTSSADCFPASGAGPQALVAQVASYDLVSGPPSRVIVGLQRADLKLVAFGTVQFRFAFLDGGKSGCQPTTPITAGFLPIPGSDVPNPVPSSPQLTSAASGRGVYGAAAGFDRPGNWEVEVTANFDGQNHTATAAFPVLAKHAVPGVGDAALPSQNLTVSTPGAPAAAIDSRAASGGSVPDADLHQTTIAAALAAHRPIVAVFATPVYCQSQFCGPVTDLVDGLAKQYSSKAAFIHVEIWHDYDQHQINQAAADWLYRNNDLNEPWVFVIGADGKIVARFDNVVTRGELEAVIQALPAAGA